ncbi:MAG: hypothetical protein ACFFER_13800, partial [Candidatus Thorarchaeota archaeon]
MMQETPPDFWADPIAYLQFYWTQISPFVFLMAMLIVIGLIYIIVTRLAKRSLLALGMGREATIGFVLILRLIFFMFAVLMLVSFFEADYATIL